MIQVITPLEGRAQYDGVWRDIVVELFKERPWDIENLGSPKGAHRFIETLEASDLLVLIDSLQQASEFGFVLLADMVNIIAEGAVELYGMSLNELSADRRKKERNRHRNQLNEQLEHLCEFGLIRQRSNSGRYFIALTEKGSGIMEEFKQKTGFVDVAA